MGREDVNLVRHFANINNLEFPRMRTAKSSLTAVKSLAGMFRRRLLILPRIFLSDLRGFLLISFWGSGIASIG